jgi:hypothetical protein
MTNRKTPKKRSQMDRWVASGTRAWASLAGIGRLPGPNSQRHSSPPTAGCRAAGDRPADLFKLSDFKLAVEEKVGERDTKVIQYTVKAKGKVTNALSMKVWLEAKTNLPVKLVLTGGGSDITDVTAGWDG